MSEISPKAESLKKLGDETFMKKDYPAAIKYYLGAVSTFPQFDKAWNNMGLAYREIDNLNFALKCFKRALQINEENDSAKANLEACEKEIQDNLFGVKRKKSIVQQYGAAKPAEEPPKVTKKAGPPVAKSSSEPETSFKEPTMLPFMQTRKEEEDIDEVMEEEDEGEEMAPPPPPAEEEMLVPPEEPLMESARREKIVIEERTGPLGLRTITVAKTVPYEAEDMEVEEKTGDYVCSECGAALNTEDTVCPSCAQEFEDEIDAGDLAGKYQECEEISENLGLRVQALHEFSEVDEDERAIFKIYRVDKFLSQAEWEINSGKFEKALKTFGDAEKMIETLSGKYLYPKAGEIYSSIRNTLLKRDDYEEHLSILAKPLFQAERALEKNMDSEAISFALRIKEYLDNMED